jgi:hypothetical protein
MLSTSIRRRDARDRHTRTCGRSGSALSVRVRRAVGVVVSVPVLAVSVVACGAGSDGAGVGGKKDGSREERASGGSGGADSGGSAGKSGGGGSGGGGAAEEKRLASALLKSGDVKGYRVQRSKKDALPAQNTVQSYERKCSAVTDVMDSDPERARTAYINGVLQKGSSPSAGGAVQQVLLASYAKGGAEEWLSDLKRALGGCKSFTAKDGAGDKVRLTVSRGPVGVVGDDSVEFTLRVKQQSDSPLVFTVVRTGGRTATFMSISLSGKPQPVEKALAVKQHRKLAALGGGR